MNVLTLKMQRIVFLSILTALCGAVLCEAADAPLSDSKITAAVDDALMFDQAVKAMRIDVSTNNGIVTLSGSTDNILAKDRAARLAQTVRGVRAVVNNVKVLSVPKTDMEIENNINDALIWDQATEALEVGVNVSAGRVTLTGTVDSWQEKQLVEKVAKGVSGVEAVTNSIVVDYKQDRSDYEMKQEIAKRMNWDAYVDDAMISVDVSNGTAVLDGTVGSAAEKQRAITNAWVAGIEDVNAESLEVAKWARDQRFRKDKFVNKQDSEVQQAVNDAFLYDPRVNMFNINVSCDAGIVTLSGIVDNLKAKRAAEMDAENTVGVWQVKNNIKVRPTAGTADSKIERRVKQALMEDPYVERFELDVNVVNNTAYLSGEVDTYFEKGQADDAASRVAGVIDVENNIDVDNEYGTLTYDPYVYPGWSVYGYPWYTYPDAYRTTDSDWEIREDIQSQLWWSPFVDESEVNVSVEDGVATLTGEVDTWNEYLAARENAIEGGAVAVRNRLDVEYGPEDD